MGDDITVWPLAESGLLARLGEAIGAPLSRKIAALTEALEAARLPGVVDLVPSYTTLAILLDPFVADVEAIERAVRRCWAGVTTADEPAFGRKVELPVVYGGEFGPDLAEVARHAGLSPAEVIRRHSEASYVVGALGFAPGFAYLIGLPSELATPRRATPRKAVPPGSIGIGGGQAGIYALPTPGGWQLIGRTMATLFDPATVGEESDNPFLLQMGDEVRFVAVKSIVPSTRNEGASAVEKAIASGRPSKDRRSGAAIAVMDGGLQTTVQDAGRPGHGRRGIAPGGAADRGALRRANRLVGNEPDAAVLEIALDGPRVRFTGLDGERLAAVTGADLGATLNGRRLPLETAVPVRDGDELRLGPRVSGARAYLAVTGGFDVPLVLGSRSTDPTAGFGGFDGRALRGGDVLPLGAVRHELAPAPAVRLGRPVRSSRPRVVRYVAGPQADRFSLTAFGAIGWRVSASSNQIGIRLEGPALQVTGGTDIVSEGMTTGGIQITNEGRPIVLLPGRGTIGGYARIGTVIGADLDCLAQLAPADTIRFQDVPMDEARALTLNISDTPPDADAGWGGISMAMGLVEQVVASSGTIGEMTVDVPGAGFHLRAMRRPEERET